MATGYTTDKSTKLLNHYFPEDVRKQEGIHIIYELAYLTKPNTPESRFKTLEWAREDAEASSSRIILCNAVINSIYEDVECHAVALKIDLQNRHIVYQDPKRTEMPAIMRSDLEKVFAGFTIEELPAIQQAKENKVDCGPIAIENLRRLVHSDSVDASLDIAAIRTKHEAALALSPSPKIEEITR